MKYLKAFLWRILPGVLCTALALTLCASLAKGDDKSASPIVAAPAPVPVYAAQSVRPQYQATTCPQCGATIDASGRAIVDRRERHEHRSDIERQAPNVVYVVHVDGVQDLRSWPQSIFPLSTRWAMPIRRDCSGY